MNVAVKQPVPTGVMPASVLDALVRQDCAGLANGTERPDYVTVKKPFTWNMLTGAGSPYYEAIFRGR